MISLQVARRRRPTPTATTRRRRRCRRATTTPSRAGVTADTPSDVQPDATAMAIAGRRHRAAAVDRLDRRHGQQFVPLRKVGRNWVGLCPFHAEKTPSFNVREETGRYKCFGCDQSRRRVHVRPGDRAPRLRRRRRAPRGQGRHAARRTRRPASRRSGRGASGWSRRWTRRSSGTTSGCSTIRPPARPATTCAARAGRRRRPPVQDRLGARRLGRAGRGGPGIDAELLRSDRAGVHQPAQPDAGLVPGPRDVPDLLRVRRGGGVRGPGPARLGRPGEVQELAGDADLHQVQDAVRAELGQGRHRRRPTRWWCARATPT